MKHFSLHVQMPYHQQATMEWSNEKTLEFLDLFQSEQCLWDPQAPTYKNRVKLSVAWSRIVESLSFQVTIEELKKKKDSLMGYYRTHLNKYKESLKSGATGENNVYTTNWFAFDLMDSFLRPIYVKNSSTSTTDDKNYKEEIINNSGPETSASTENNSNNQRKSRFKRNSPKIKTFKRPHGQYKKPQPPPEIMNVDNLKSIANRKEEKLDEYDHFAFMIASKIRKIQSSDDREGLMNRIQNLTYQFIMKSNNKKSTARLTKQSRIPQNEVDASRSSSDS